MATHNQVRVVGFLLNDPHIVNEGMQGAERIVYQVRTVHRDLDGFNGAKFQDLVVFYAGEEYMERMKKLQKYDLVDIKGVFNIQTLGKKSRCPGCSSPNTKWNGQATFIYPIHFTKINGLRTAFEHSMDSPERILEKHFMEVSNQVLIIGTVVSDPELLMLGKLPCCRYKLGVDKKYFIKTQSDIYADYPWVYSYAQQAERDYTHLKNGSLVLIDGFIQNRKINNHIQCQTCGISYEFPDQTTEFIPYSVEYLSDYITDEEIALTKEFEQSKALHDARASIFG